MHPAAADPVSAGRISDGQALVTNCEDDDFLLRHESCATVPGVNDVPTHQWAVSCERCPDSCVNYVVKLDTGKDVPKFNG